MSDLVKRERVDVPTVHVPTPQTIWVDGYLDSKESDFKKYARIIRRRKWMIAAVTSAAIGAAIVWVLVTKPLYKSSVEIQIEPEQNVLPYKDLNVTNEDPRYLDTQAEVLKSEVLARRVVTRLGLASSPERLASVAGGFAGRLEVTSIPLTEVVKVSYMAEDPQFAATAVNALADEYVNYIFETRRESATGARDFLGGELLTLKQKLEASEEALVRYAREHSLRLTAADKDNAVLQKYDDLNKEMTTVEEKLLANQYVAIKNTTPDTFPETMKTPAMKDIEARRSVLEERLANLKMQFGPRWPEVITLTEQVNDLKRQMARETKSAIAQAKMEYDLALGHRARVAAALADQSRLADRLTEDSIQYNILKREVDSDRQLHDSVLQRVKEASLSAGLKSGNIHVLDRGHVPSKPAYPNVPLTLGLGLTLGLVAGIGLAWVMEFVHGTIGTAEDVEELLRLPLLGTIPAFQGSWKETTGGVLVAPVGRAQQKQLAASVNRTANQYWEHYRSLRTSLLFSSAERQPQSILVTSAIPGEGKSTTVVNLGISLAQTGARTLIIDLDLRKPRLAELFHAARSPGISRYLTGHSELHTEIQDTGIPNLFLVGAGPVPPNAPELIGSGRMSFGLQLLSQHFEFIVIDGPPVLAVTDALVIARQVDGVLLVVHGGKTPTTVVEKAKSLLKSIDARILGAIVNQLDLPDSRYGGYGGYYGAPNAN
jgi:capsular exopolysaccharide synthesis family protein